jgi:hypothetical protein
MKVNKIPWAEKEIKVLRKWYPLYPIKISQSDLLKLFPCRSWNAISGKARELKIYVESGAVDYEFLKQLEKSVKV